MVKTAKELGMTIQDIEQRMTFNELALWAEVWAEEAKEMDKQKKSSGKGRSTSKPRSFGAGRRKPMGST